MLSYLFLQPLPRLDALLSDSTHVGEGEEWGKVRSRYDTCIRCLVRLRSLWTAWGRSQKAGRDSGRS